MVKNGHGLLGLGTLLLYHKNELIESADFSHVDTNLGKLRVILIVRGWAWSKMGGAL